MADTAVEGRPLDETQLVSDARSGDLGAFEELVRIHQSTAIRLAYLLVRDHGEAEEVAQDAFVKAFRALDRFREGSPFRPWLLTIVRNEAANRRRSGGRRRRLALRVAAEPVSGEAAQSPETVVIDEERARTVLVAVDGLPDRYRLVVSLRYLLGLTEAETAAVLAIATGTVKSRTSRALWRLRNLMEAADV
ncbi:MAG: RNA polymerase sigma factor [Acidimicrobiia bacterium]